MTEDRHVREVRPGVWHWTSPHPAWDGEEGWPELVSSYGIELDDDFVLFDPLSPTSYASARLRSS